jgi:hypothetical protein
VEDEKERLIGFEAFAVMLAKEPPTLVKVMPPQTLPELIGVQE